MKTVINVRIFVKSVVLVSSSVDAALVDVVTDDAIRFPVCYGRHRRALPVVHQSPVPLKDDVRLDPHLAAERVPNSPSSFLFLHRVCE